MAEKTDLRIVKTHRAIREAFFKLMYAKGFESVTVQQIIDEALVNRSTFYAHYRDKYDLRESIENELLQGFADRAKQNIPPIAAMGALDETTYRNYLNTMLDYVEEHGKLFSYLLGPEGDPAFQSKLSSKAREVWIHTGLIDRLALPERYAFAGLSGMLSSILAEWAKSGFSDGRDEVLDTLVALLTDLSGIVVG